MSTGLQNLKKYASALSDVPSDQAVIATDSTVDLSLVNLKSTYIITKSGACAITLPAPTAGTPVSGGHDGLRLTFVSNNAAAHTVTNASPGFNNGGAAQDVATFAATLGSSLTVEAYNGAWFVISNNGITLS